jgi:hypothetical protein
MVFRLEPIALSSTTCECIQHDDFRPGLPTNSWGVLPCNKDAELVHDRAGKRGSLIVKKLIFPIVKIGPSLRQNHSADTLISNLEVPVVESH